MLQRVFRRPMPGFCVPTALLALVTVAVCGGCATGEHGVERSVSEEETEATCELAPVGPPAALDEAQVLAQVERALEEAETWEEEEAREVERERQDKRRVREDAHEETAAQFQEAEWIVERFRVLGQVPVDAETFSRILQQRRELVWDLEEHYEHMDTNGSIYWETAIECRRGDLYRELAEGIVVPFGGYERVSPFWLRYVNTWRQWAIGHYERAILMEARGGLTSANEWTRKARRRLRIMKPCHPVYSALACGGEDP